jgi:TonB family protein
MKTIFTGVFTLLVIAGFAQKRNAYFYKNNGREVAAADSSDYIRFLIEPDPGSNIYKVKEFYKNGKAKLIGNSFDLVPPKFDGQQLTYFANGHKKSMKTYSKGRLVVDEYDYYPNGKRYLDIKHPDVGENGPSLIMACYDSLGTALATEGNGVYKGYDDEFNQVVEEGNIKDGKKDGVWHGHEDGVIFSETFENGNMVSGRSRNRDGRTMAYTSRSTPPQFKDEGTEGFLKYLKIMMRYPQGDRKEGVEGRVTAVFEIEKDGTVSHLDVLRAPDNAMVKEVTDVIKKAPKWTPASKFGFPVKTLVSLPINFRLESRNTALIIVEPILLQDLHN